MHLRSNPLLAGVEFYLRNASIPTGGSGRLLITDIRLRNGQSSTSNEDALICRSSRDVEELRDSKMHTDWYLDSEQVETTKPIVSGRRITESYGWTRNRGTVISTSGIHYIVVRLKRKSETVVEGKFTCHIREDNHNNKSLLILYPSESLFDVLSIQVSHFLIYKQSTYTYPSSSTICGSSH